MNTSTTTVTSEQLEDIIDLVQEIKTTQDEILKLLRSSQGRSRHRNNNKVSGMSIAKNMLQHIVTDMVGGKGK
jgi:hypothetical protein